MNLFFLENVVSTKSLFVFSISLTFKAILYEAFVPNVMKMINCPSNRLKIHAT